MCAITFPPSSEPSFETVTVSSITSSTVQTVVFASTVMPKSTEMGVPFPNISSGFPSDLARKSYSSVAISGFSYPSTQALTAGAGVLKISSSSALSSLSLSIWDKLLFSSSVAKLSRLSESSAFE